MRCIFCLEDRPGSVEHVFPKAIGGTLTFDRVCQSCNSMLGTRVDAALSDSFMVRGRRAELGLAGNSGVPPALHEILLGVHELDGKPDQRIEVTFNKATRKLELRTLHHASDVTMPDGTKARQIVVDTRDVDQIPKIIQRERKRHGLEPLPEEQLAEEVRKFTGNSITIAKPTLLIKRTYDESFLRHALAKIAYELAFLWLGERYLDDPSAVVLRAAICDPSSNSIDGLPAWFGDAEVCEVLQFWSADKNHHLAYAFPSESRIALVVRVFDIHAAAVWVTQDAARYLSEPDAGSKVRFLAIDAVSGQMRDTPFMDEVARCVAAASKAEAPRA